jgi:hypothetical protein
MKAVRVIMTVQALTGKIRQFRNDVIREHLRAGLLFKYLIGENSGNQASYYA